MPQHAFWYNPYMNFELKKELYQAWMRHLSPIEQADVQRILGEHPEFFEVVLQSMHLKQQIASGDLSPADTKKAAQTLMDLEKKAVRSVLDA